MGHVTQVTDAEYRLGQTVLTVQNGQLRIARLAGMASGELDDPLALRSASRQYRANDWQIVSVRAEEHQLSVERNSRDGLLQLESAWSVDPETQIVRRRDRLTNLGAQTQIFTQLQIQLALPRGHYELYSQASRWCHESQGSWQTVTHGAVVLRGAPGRSTEGGTPFAVVRRQGDDVALALHVVPDGDWQITFQRRAAGGDLPLAILTAGLDERDCRIPLDPGGTLELPELWLQGVPAAAIHRDTALLHRWAARQNPGSAKAIPIVYNTWFDQFDQLNVARLRQQLARAREIGCDIFTVDAGWYGQGGANWFSQTGDWQEARGRSFDGNMAVFADEVRAAGLGFGLWMEPERIGSEARIKTLHPGFFADAGNGNCRVRLEQPEPRAWLKSEIERLLQTYRLAWMKIDFNFDLGTDETGTAFRDYSRSWRSLLAELRATHPQCIFEGCASGALRADWMSLYDYDQQFLSDTIHPIDVIRITQGSWLRLAPGRLGRWVGLRAARGVLPEYGRTAAESEPALLVPGGALWNPSETVNLDFAALAASPGAFGLTGDLIDLPDTARRRLAQVVAFQKRYGENIARAEGYLLTPPEPLENRSGWVGLQLHDRAADRSLVYAYKLGAAAGAAPVFRPRGLTAERAYRMTQGIDQTPHGERSTGAQLMTDGMPLPPVTPGPWDGGNWATVIVIEPAE